jgi:hypothetical protein
LHDYYVVKNALKKLGKVLAKEFAISGSLAIMLMAVNAKTAAPSLMMTG